MMETRTLEHVYWKDIIPGDACFHNGQSFIVIDVRSGEPFGQDRERNRSSTVSIIAYVINDRGDVQRLFRFAQEGVQIVVRTT